jgi:hypothetical protein
MFRTPYIDTTNPLIERFNNAIKYSCAKTKLEESKKKGDIKMLSLLEGFLTKEERAAAALEGEIRGETKSEIKGAISLLVSLGKSNSEIAGLLHLNVDEVNSLREKFGLNKKKFFAFFLNPGYTIYILN